MSPDQGQETTTETTSQTSGTDEAAAAAAAAAAAGGAGKAGKAPAADKPFYADWAEDLRASQSVVNAKSPEEIARQLVLAEKRLGAPADQLLRVPQKPEDWKEFWGKLGAPEKADGYKIDLGDKASDADKAAAADFSKVMHEKGPFPAQFVTEAMAWWKDFTGRQDAALVEADTQAREAAEGALKQEFGAAWEQTQKEVGRLLNEHGDKGLYEELFVTGAADSPKLFKALAKVVARMAEGTGPGAGNASVPVAMTPDQAKAARLALEADEVKGQALQDKGHAMHKTVLQERERYLAYEAGRSPS
jgi:hypothetical protein